MLFDDIVHRVRRIGVVHAHQRRVALPFGTRDLEVPPRSAAVHLEAVAVVGAVRIGQVDAQCKTLLVPEGDALTPELDAGLQADLLLKLLEARGREAVRRLTVGLHEAVECIDALGEVLCAERLGLDQVHLLDTHERMIDRITHGIGRVVALSGTELDRSQRLERISEEGLVVRAAALVVVVVEQSGIEPRVLAEVVVGDLRIEVRVDAAAHGLAIVGPVLLGGHVGNERVEVVDGLRSLDGTPHPRVVARRAVEAGRRILPLGLRQRRVAAGRDRLAGVVGRLLVGSVHTGRAALEVGTGRNTVDDAQVGHLLRRAGVVSQHALGALQVGEDHLVVDLGHRSTRIALGLLLGGVLRDDDAGQVLDVVGNRVVVHLRAVALLGFEQTHQVEVELCAERKRDAQIAPLVGVEALLRNGREGRDHVVATLDPRVVVVPELIAGDIVLAQVEVAHPVGEPVVAGVPQHDHVARHAGERNVDRRVAEVPGLRVVLGIERQGAGDGIHHRVEGRGRFGDLVGRRPVGGEGLLDTAAQRSGRHGRCDYVFEYGFHCGLKELELNIDTARNRPDRRVVGVIRRTGVAVTGIEALTARPVVDIVARQVDAQLAYAELAGEGLGKRISHLDVRDVEVRCIEQEAVGGADACVVAVLEARNRRRGILGRPRLEDVLVEVAAGRRAVRRSHARSVARVIAQTADLVGERSRYIDTEELERGGETAVEVGKGRTAEVVGRLGVGGRRLTRDVALGVGHILVPHRQTGRLIDTRILGDVPRVVGKPFADEIASVSISLVALRRGRFTLGSQVGHLVLVVRHVQGQIPAEVFRLNGGSVKRDLETAVAHVTHVVVVARVARRRSHGEEEEHVGGLAVEVLDRTAQAAAEQLEVRTDVDVRVGLPRDLLVALRGENDRHLAAGVLDVVVVHVEEVADVVVTLRTDRGLELQHVHPIDIEPRLVVDEPCGAGRPEVAPAVVGVEARRGIATVRTVEDDPVVKLILDAAEITLVVVLGRIGCRPLRIDDRAVELEVADREHLLLRTAQHVVLLVVELVSDHGAQAVLAGEGVAVVEQLLGVDLERALRLHRHTAARIGKLAVVGVVHRVETHVIEVRTDVESGGQIAEELHVGKGRPGERIAVAEVLVELHALQGVEVGHERTRQTGIHAVAVVVHLQPVLVIHDVAVAVTDVDRIDRSGVVGKGEDIGRSGRSGLVAEVVALIVRVAGIRPDLQPLLGLIVGTQTGRVTGIAGTGDDTLVVQIAERSIEIGPVVGRRDVHVVLLAQRRAVGLIDPVVGSQVVVLSVVGNLAAQRGVGIDLAVRTDEQFALGHRVDLIAETSGIAAGQQLVGADGRIVGREAVAAVVVVERLVVGLVVLGRIVWTNEDSVVNYLIQGAELMSGKKQFDKQRSEKLIRAEFNRANNYISMFNHAALQGGEEYWNRLNEIKQPTLIIHGTDDKIWHYKNAGFLLEKIKGSNLITLEGTGHELHVDDWKSIIDGIEKHIND